MKKLILFAGFILGFSILNLSVSAQTATATDKSATVQETQAAPSGQAKVTDNNKAGTSAYQQNNVKNEKCASYVDKNGDGKCDNCTGNGTCSKGKCCNKEMSKGNCCPPKSGQGMENKQGNACCPKQCRTSCK